MQAVILAGGEGARMRPLTLHTPKPLLPVVGRPLVAHLLDRLPRSVDHVVLTVSYRAADLAAWAQATDDPALEGRDVLVVEETVPLGTAGAVKNAADVLDGTFFVLNGDLVSDVDLTALAARHGETGALGTIALHEVADPTRFGVVQQASNGRITRFVEKPRIEEAPSRRVNAGAYVLDLDVLRHIPTGRAVSIEREVFPVLCAQPRGLYGLVFDGLWIDCGTPTSYLEVHRALMARAGADREIGAGAEVAADADIAASWLGPGVSVAAAARVHGSVLHERVQVAAGAQLDDCIIGAQAQVGAGARLVRTVVAPGAMVPAGAVLEGTRWGSNERSA